MRQIRSKKMHVGHCRGCVPQACLCHLPSDRHDLCKAYWDQRSYLFANRDWFCHIIGPCQNSSRLAWMISGIIGSIKTSHLEQPRKNERNCLHPPFSFMSSSFPQTAFWLAHPCSLLHMDSGISEANVFPSAIGLSVCNRQRHCGYGPYRYH